MGRQPAPAKTDEWDPVSADSVPITFDPQKGRVFLQGLPVWFMSPLYYADMQVQLETLMGKAARGILYRAAEKAGERVGQLLAPGMPAGSDEMARVSILLRAADLLPVAGHGRARLVVGDLGEVETTWTLDHSYIAEIRAPRPEPVCHYYAGYLAGLTSVVFGRTVACEEVECRATGAKACVFRTRAP